MANEPLPLNNFIDGQYVAPAQGGYMAVEAPAVGAVYARVADSDEQDVAQAVAAAEQAFPTWAALQPPDRAAWLNRIAAGIEVRLGELAEAESRDTGKPLSLARRVDIPRAVQNFRFFAGACQHFASEAHPMGERALNYTLRHPLGPVAAISPWNLPLYLFTWKIAPALAAGNTVVAKPSELTPMTAYLLGEICQEAELPAGVLNILQGTGPKTGQAMIEHPAIQAITFTGGTQTGRTIARTAAPAFKKLSLELGGKNPNVIFADCNYEQALATAVRAAFTNQGEICLCGSRLFVEEAIYEQFKADFVARVEQLQVGDPQAEHTDLGALISQQHKERVLGYIQLAREEGGQVLTGGHELQLTDRCADGHFVAPTVIEGLDAACRTNQEEIFGPVVTLIPFRDEATMLEQVNSTPYGLAAMLWTEDLRRAHRVASKIRSGIVWVNTWMLRDLRTPFGGMKQSGLGREGGWEAMRFFTEPQNICLDFADTDA